MRLFITILITCIFLAVISNAQKIKFTDATNVWYYNFGNQTIFGVVKGEMLGDTLINGSIYKKTGFQEAQLIREDTIVKKVYVYKDPIEHLLYDFSPVLGDTFKSAMPFLSGAHVLTKIDSIILDSIWYKTFHYQPVNGGNGLPYVVIENIGCVEGIGFPFWNYVTVEYSESLRCFFNKGHKIDFPIGWGINIDSCYEFSQYVSVKNIPQKRNLPIIYPNPITERSVIAFDGVMTDGQLYVWNSIGQLVLKKRIEGVKELSLKSICHRSGIYFYNVVDNISGMFFTVRFIVE